MGSSSLALAETPALEGQAPEATPAEAEGSFRDIPVLEVAFVDTAPARGNGTFPVGELSIASEKEASLVKLAQELGESQHGQYDSLLIAHKGQLVFESYTNRGRINLAHGQASATKGYTSLILGRAIQMGYLTMADLDKPLISFLKDVDPTTLAEGAEKITLHKALTMHGGLNVDEAEWENLQENPAQLKGQGLVQTLLENTGPITAETQIYRYGNFNPNLVMAVIDGVAPGTAEEFIRTEVLDKLQISNYTWATHISDMPEAGWMVSMTSRDMLKWGSLVLDKGKWNGEQLISAEYIDKATSGLTNPTIDWIPEAYRYGYFWYQAPIAADGKSYDATFAWGGGGQRVIVLLI